MNTVRSDEPPGWINPFWPAPPNVRALSTFRYGGVSRGAYSSLNLAAHVGDDAEAVACNRARLARAAALPAEPCWLSQVHGTGVVDAATAPSGVEADAAVTARRGVVCAVLTADCLPVLLSDRAGTRVGAVHAGWRGLAGGVIEAAVIALGGGADLIAWLGPAIGREAFEVGDEVRARFVETDPGAAAAFRPGRKGHWFADLYELARRRLVEAGVAGVSGGGRCTYRESGSFYSYRRDRVTGRMASLIWLADAAAQ